MNREYFHILNEIKRLSAVKASAAEHCDLKTFIESKEKIAKLEKSLVNYKKKEPDEIEKILYPKDQIFLHFEPIIEEILWKLKEIAEE